MIIGPENASNILCRFNVKKVEEKKKKSGINNGKKNIDRIMRSEILPNRIKFRVFFS